jgi:glutamate-ammonia-ligase adenylyltransferase
MRALSAMTAEGRAFPVDARLRPEGEKGPLTCSLESYQDYFAQRGQLWEAQALTKARPIGGPQQREFLEVAKRIWRRFGAREDLFAEIAAMHERIRKERVSDEMLDFKTGRGGLMQVEFFIQAQQMRAGLWANNTLDALAELETDAATAIARDYLFLRKVEGVLRLADDTSVSQLPKDALEQQRLAIRCGFSSRESFLEAMRNARESIALLAPLAPTQHE